MATDEKSIYSLLKEQETEHRDFLVPSYQRGYRWQRVNVTDLLNDLCEFIHSDKKKYSLQPLVVALDSDNNTYHVVDGQQRLTTISILLGYLGQKQLSITYESRKGQQKNCYIEVTKDAVECAKDYVKENASDLADTFFPGLVDLTESYLDANLNDKAIRKAFVSHNTLELDESWFWNTSVLKNESHPDGVTVSLGIFGQVIPFVEWDDVKFFD